MDALELQAALVKLDPATTVTPIVPQHQINFGLNLDETDLSLQNKGHNGQQQARKFCGGGHHHHQNNPPVPVKQPVKCAIGEVR
ncbi:uncharacterized protein LOC106646161 [Copidosoma floridanum]|uniref:uncharacterized protein LOC106646161 n=1 Tax=Copidosoma floridanum TaxID=29053 RepID=UPI000C6FA1D0|nr:uncharacterized protein LOC106646161 [Copidosoma floridanum]